MPVRARVCNDFERVSRGGRGGGANALKHPAHIHTTNTHAHYAITAQSNLYSESLRVCERSCACAFAYKFINLCGCVCVWRRRRRRRHMRNNVRRSMVHTPTQTHAQELYAQWPGVVGACRSVAINNPSPRTTSPTDRRRTVCHPPDTFCRAAGANVCESGAHTQKWRPIESSTCVCI